MSDDSQRPLLEALDGVYIHPAALGIEDEFAIPPKHGVWKELAKSVERGLEGMPRGIAVRVRPEQIREPILGDGFRAEGDQDLQELERLPWGLAPEAEDSPFILDLDATREQPVTWSATGYQVTLAPQGYQIVATTNFDVGPTPYYIEIFKMPFNSGSASRLTACGSGTRCAVDISDGYFVAFVSHYDTAYLPSGIQASSPLLLYSIIN